MDIVVVGCGKIGSEIISSLVKEGHNVLTIDENPKTISDITNTYDVMAVCGDGTNYETLREASVDKADLFVSVTGTDEDNMLSCFMAKKMGAKHTIARVRQPKYSQESIDFLHQHLEISRIINPEYLAASEIFNLLKVSSATKTETFSGRNFEMAEFKLKEDTVLDGMSVKEIRSKYEVKFLIAVVKRGEDVIIPNGDFVIAAGDKIGVVATLGELLKLLKLLGISKKQAKNVVLLGAGRTTFYLAKMLIAAGINVKIVDNDENLCKEFSEALPAATVINGDGTLQDVLLEEGIHSADAFAALTGFDEENILISYFASSQNVPKVIAKVNRGELGTMAEKMGIDSVVSPKKIISDIIVSYARAVSNSLGSKVSTLYKLMDEKAEALEFTVSKDFRYTNMPLSEMKLKKNILIAGIIRGRKTIIPSGADIILPDDKVVVISAGSGLKDLEDIIK